jgi:hypothetical protein
MIGRHVVDLVPHERTQRQRISAPPGNAALRIDALEVPDQQQPEIDPRRQRWPAQLLGVELGAQLLDKRIELPPGQHLI